MVLYSILETRTIRYINKTYPEKRNESTYFFGQKIRYRKLESMIKTGKCSDSELLDFMRKSKRLTLFALLMFGLFIILLAASKV